MWLLLSAGWMRFNWYSTAVAGGMMSEVFGALIDYWPVTVLLSLGVVWYGWKRLHGALRVFVMMAGGSVAGFLVAAFLHNAVAALSARLWGPPGFEEPVFFITAVIICPILFLVGLVGAVVVSVRERIARQRPA
jgi:hypothetical protein